MASHQLDVLRVPGSIPGVAKFFLFSFSLFSFSLSVLISISIYMSIQFSINSFRYKKSQAP